LIENIKQYLYNKFFKKRRQKMNDEFKLPSYIQPILVIGIIFVVFLGMKYSSEILGPIFLSIFISIIIYPFLMWLKRRGLSYNSAVLVTIAGILALGAAIIGFLVVTLAQFVQAIPTFTIQSGFLSQYGDQLVKFLVENIPIENAGGLISMGIFLLFSVIFLVYELPNIKTRLEKSFGADSATLNTTLSLVRDTVEYFVIRAKVNLFYGLSVSVILYIFDINFALLWGLLTFALGFIPYIGIIIAAIPPVLIAWSQFGIQGAIIMAVFFIILNTIAESIIFPRLTGKGLQMSVYVVFVSLFVWGWALGPVGFLIGVPLTLVVIRFLENYNETKWLASLMSSGDEDEPEKKEK
jgi:predicted PurR-regulated permease PerM